MTHALSFLTLASAALVLGSISACSGQEGLSPAAERGRVVFFESSNPKCATCHGLDYEGTPLIPGMGDLDERRPTAAQVERAVLQGIGMMTSQKGNLTPEQIEDVAAYVSEVAGRPKR